MVQLLKFGTKGCGPCATLDKVLGDLFVERIDCHENPEIAQHYGIMQVPAVIVLRDGVVVDKIVGVQPRGNYSKYLEGN